MVLIVLAKSLQSGHNYECFVVRMIHLTVDIYYTITTIVFEYPQLRRIKQCL